MRMRIVNGPNLNQLGKREPEIYGDKSYEDLCQFLNSKALAAGIDLEILQSHYEGQLIEWVLDQEAYDGLIINPAGYSHTSIALLDALKIVSKKVVEVHLTNIHQREDYRQISLTAKGSDGVIAGLGFDSYSLAMTYLMHADD